LDGGTLTGRTATDADQIKIVLRRHEGLLAGRGVILPPLEGGVKEDLDQAGEEGEDGKLSFLREFPIEPDNAFVASKIFCLYLPIG
jgi:hypothetical protein